MKNDKQNVKAAVGIAVIIVSLCCFLAFILIDNTPLWVGTVGAAGQLYMAFYLVSNDLRLKKERQK